MRRDLSAATLVGFTLLATVPAYDRVFSTPSWRGPAVAAALLALVLASLIRRLHRGAWVAGLVSVLGFVAAAPWLLGQNARPVLPRLSVLADLWQLLAVGRTELAETPAPTLPLAGLMLLVIGGWWLVAHVAHELSVRWRRPGFALAVLAVLWAAPLAVPMSDQTGWGRTLPFLAMACLTLLVTGSEDLPDETRVPVPASGVALGAAAIAIGLTMPGLLPGYAEPAWVQLGASSSPRGYQPIVDVSQRLGLPEERDVLRVRASQRTYLRLAGLESFDGDVWRLGPPGSGSYRPDPASLFAADGPLPPEQQAANTESVQVDIEVLELDNIYVPVPYQPVEVFGPIRDDMIWSTEGGFLATWDTVEGEVDGEPRVGIREGVEYRVQAARPAPTFDELLTTTVDETDRERFTSLPRDYPELGAQAEQVYEAAGATTTVERALALQDWFVGPDGDFTYDLDVPALRGEDALTDFVLEDRVGYCEYFATAMAVMLRQTGIPARVATGFLPGRVTSEADLSAGIEFTEYTVSTADAHAWVEVLFPGAGWVTFEPTPRDDNSHILPTQNDLTPIENVAERREREAEESEDDPAADPTIPDAPDLPEADFQDPSATGDQAADEGSGSEGADPSAWLLIVAVVAVMVAALLLARRRRDDRGSDRTPQRRVLDAQRDLLTTAARHGVGRSAHETTVELVERWRFERRIDERGVVVAVAAQAAAFGGTVDTSEAAEVERLVAELEQMLRDSVSSQDRLLAPLRLPLGHVQRWGRTIVERLVRWRTDG